MGDTADTAGAVDLGRTGSGWRMEQPAMRAGRWAHRRFGDGRGVSGGRRRPARRGVRRIAHGIAAGRGGQSAWAAPRPCPCAAATAGGRPGHAAACRAAGSARQQARPCPGRLRTRPARHADRAAHGAVAGCPPLAVRSAPGARPTSSQTPATAMPGPRHQRRPGPARAGRDPTAPSRSAAAASSPPRRPARPPSARPSAARAIPNGTAAASTAATTGISASQRPCQPHRRARSGRPVAMRNAQASIANRRQRRRRRRTPAAAGPRQAIAPGRVRPGCARGWPRLRCPATGHAGCSWPAPASSSSAAQRQQPARPTAPGRVRTRVR